MSLPALLLAAAAYAKLPPGSPYMDADMSLSLIPLAAIAGFGLAPWIALILAAVWRGQGIAYRHVVLASLAGSAATAIFAFGAFMASMAWYYGPTFAACLTPAFAGPITAALTVRSFANLLPGGMTHDR